MKTLVISMLLVTATAMAVQEKKSAVESSASTLFSSEKEVEIDGDFEKLVVVKSQPNLLTFVQSGGQIVTPDVVAALEILKKADQTKQMTAVELAIQGLMVK